MMPDTDPVIDDVALVEFVLRTARDTAVVNVYPAAAITKGLAGREMTEFGLLREAGAVAFTEGRHTIASALVMRRALTYARDFGAVIAHETEDADLAAGGVMNEGLYASWLGLVRHSARGRDHPARARPALGAADRRRTTTPPRSRPRCRPRRSPRAKADGAKVTAGVSINNLSLNENDVGEYRTFFRLSPPLRAEDDRLAMIEALRGRHDRHHRLLARSAGRRHQAPALRRRRGRRDRAGDAAAARRCGCITMATCRCCGWSRRCPPRRQDCSACRAAR